MTSIDHSKICQAERVSGYVFRDKKLLWEALQPAGSPVKEIDGRAIQRGGHRLAIIGDAALDHILSVRWFYANTHEGQPPTLEQWTRAWQPQVTNVYLATLCRQSHLHFCLNRPPSHSGPIGIRAAATMLKAVIGAVDLDSRGAAVGQVLYKLGINADDPPEFLKEQYSQLQRWRLGSNSPWAGDRGAPNNPSGLPPNASRKRKGAADDQERTCGTQDPCQRCVGADAGPDAGSDRGLSPMIQRSSKRVRTLYTDSMVEEEVLSSRSTGTRGTELQVEVEVPGEVPRGVKREIPKVFPRELHREVRKEVPREVKTEVLREIKRELPRETPGVVSTEVPSLWGRLMGNMRRMSHNGRFTV